MISTCFFHRDLALTPSAFRKNTTLNGIHFNRSSAADQLLTFIAESHINMEAEDECVYSWGKEKTKEPGAAEAGL